MRPGPGPLPPVDHLLSGHPLPTDSSGHFVDQFGDPIVLDEFGRPLGPDGLPLSTNPNGEFIFHTGSPPSLPTSTLPAVPRRFPSPLPTDVRGHPLTLPAEEENIETAKTLPTDTTGKLVFPVVSADTGELLARNDEGRFVSLHSEVIA